MIRVSELSGAWLDYWVARAEGIPAEQLEVRQIQRSTEFHCVRRIRHSSAVVALDYSASWALCGSLIYKHRIHFSWTTRGDFVAGVGKELGNSYGAGPQEAICRAVVRAAFGEEVPEVTS